MTREPKRLGDRLAEAFVVSLIILFNWLLFFGSVGGRRGNPKTTKLLLVILLLACLVFGVGAVIAFAVEVWRDRKSKH